MNSKPVVALPEVYQDLEDAISHYLTWRSDSRDHFLDHYDETLCLASPSAIHTIPIMKELVFEVTQEADGGYVARWDDPQGGGITTQGENLADLQAMVTDAVGGYFEPGQAPATIRLHFARDPVVAVA